MVFSSLVFLCIFLPLTLTVYYATPARWRNHVALAASLLFYTWGAPRFVFILVASSAVDYAAGRYLSPGTALRPQVRRAILCLAIVTNLGALLYFKFMNFFVEQLNQILGFAGADPLTWQEVLLPIGISFFTFQKLSYIIDVYRGSARPSPNFRDYLLYVALFPQLIAGPIVRYHDVAAQLVSRRYCSERFLQGLWRFCLGLGRKVLIANALGEVADRAFDSEMTTLSAQDAWLGLLCYSFQIYFDFSGYSDMAIGLGKMLGLNFLENFNFPYIASSFTEFWRRWHISLSNWMREYLYIPLGGNRVPIWRQTFNLWLVFLISGFWHGASWNFILWGGYHGIFLSLDKLAQHRAWRPPPRLLSIPATFFLVILGWVFFRSDTLPDALHFFMCLAGQTAGGAADVTEPLMGIRAWVAMGAALAVSLAPLFRGHELLKDWPIEGCSRYAHFRVGIRFLLSIVLLVCCLFCLIAGQFNPFIYFRF